MKRTKTFRLLLIFLLSGLILFLTENSSAQSKISEDEQAIQTYPYSDPDPVPMLISNSKIYPYYRFEGYSRQSTPEDWKVITLENDYVKVLVLPEAGGKVWGAFEKSTGQEFIYHNQVMKFRNIAMRGPWTSGGIEFNFGIIGHSPSTASKVDYLYRKNADGSVSCFVGNLDLPSRTYWEVEIRLPEDKAYFETNALWYNPTPLHQSYYNWMTGSAAVNNDLEFFAPGNLYLEHNGEAFSWPVDSEGRKISLYKDNNFGSSKSYHITGVYDEFFGGYYHDSDFGYGHWATYDDMPGHKLWLWALSRSGGIWEDLLTDTDGQYIEFQAGRLFNQYSPGKDKNPIRQVGFAPYTTDKWKDIWFPFKNTGGMVAVSPYGVLNVRQSDTGTEININALSTLNDTLYVTAHQKVLYQENVKLKPMQNYIKNLTGLSQKDINVELGNNHLFYSTSRDSLRLKRPFKTDPSMKVSELQDTYNAGLDAMYYREYTKSQELFNSVLDKDPSHQGTLLGLGELLYRKGLYEEALKTVDKVLMQNTYQADANFLAGITYRALGDEVNALESLGWAARSMEYRSSAYSIMSEIYIFLRNYSKAVYYAEKSLNYNRFNISASLAYAIAERKLGVKTKAEQILDSLLDFDPLNHAAEFELFMLTGSETDRDHFMAHITNEFPAETYLETALFYYSLDLTGESLIILSIGPESVKNDLWKAYIYDREDPQTSDVFLDKVISSGPEFVFPYRRETIEVLNWARQKRESWKLNYYQALNYAGTGRLEEASLLLKSCGNNPDFWPFYIVRADLPVDTDTAMQWQDINKAFQLAPDEWRTWDRLVRFYESRNDFITANEYARQAWTKFPENYTLGFLVARTSLEIKDYDECIRILNHIHILPFEGSYESHVVYERAHLMKSLNLIAHKSFRKAIQLLDNALKWPENIGVGKPYDPDQRKEEFLLAYCYNEIRDRDKSRLYLNNVISYTNNNFDRSRPDDLLALVALKSLDRKEEAENLLLRIQKSPDYREDLSQWIKDQYQQKKEISGKISDSNPGDNSRELTARIADLFR